MTALAASFMRSSARLSLGFSKPYLVAKLLEVRHVLWYLGHAQGKRVCKRPYLVKPRPSTLITIHVFGRSLSGCSNCLTYSYLKGDKSVAGFKAPHMWACVLRISHLGNYAGASIFSRVLGRSLLQEGLSL
jgi:hypothetical protein